MKSTISSKGQITVPLAIRNRLGLKAGAAVVFEMTKRGVFLRKAAAGEHAGEQVYGVLHSKLRTDDLIDELRGPRPGKRARRG